MTTSALAMFVIVNMILLHLPLELSILVESSDTANTGDGLTGGRVMGDREGGMVGPGVGYGVGGGVGFERNRQTKGSVRSQGSV